ncbi:MAG: redoxin domain-containing protein [Bacteroidales bacterium]|nr:redoxin domain-containing protein [Candidatus Cacconaster merdequi]
MKRLAVFLTLFFIFSMSDAANVCGKSASDQEKSGWYSSVTDYLESIMVEPVDSICVKVDSLVAALEAQGAEKQATVAGLAFDFFCNSPIMGQEAVAVHIADTFFLSGKLKWSDDSTYPLLYSFAEFNRSSLLGMDAPQLRMESIEGIPVSIRDLDSRYKVLFFYDTSCATCKEMTRGLASFAENYHGSPLTLYAVYTQGDRASWEAYVKEHFEGIDNKDINIVHLWDPEVKSDFQRKYGLLTTPSLFLLDFQNKIVGRKMDPDALSGILLGEETELKQYRVLFDKVFASLRPLDDTAAGMAADAFAKRTESDSALFRRTMYNLYEYFRSSREPELQQGAYDVAEKYIAGMPGYWSDEYVSCVVHHLAQAKMNPLGSVAPDLLLENGRFRIRRLLECNTQYHLIMFHLIDCEECVAEINALERIRKSLGNAGISVTLVYVGDDDRRWKEFIKRKPSGWRYLHLGTHAQEARRLYDLEEVPRTYLLDWADVIVGRNFRIDELEGWLTKNAE